VSDRKVSEASNEETVFGYSKDHGGIHRAVPKSISYYSHYAPDMKGESISYRPVDNKIVFKDLDCEKVKVYIDRGVSVVIQKIFEDDVETREINWNRVIRIKYNYPTLEDSEE